MGFGGGFIFSAHAEGGFIKALQSSPGVGRDAIRLTDRFFGPQLSGFDIRGIGPRIQRVPYDASGALTPGQAVITDALGGKAYYMGRLELELPVSSGLKSAGLRPSVYVDAGSLWNITRPILTDVIATCVPLAANTTGKIFQIVPGSGPQSCGADSGTSGFTRIPGFKEFFLGNSPQPRVAVGIGVNWISPFGPLRLDLAKALIKQKGDDTKLFQFNVGTSF
jgi:outer membrane protein insertion porin family